jgi:hypothetical protein
MATIAALLPFSVDWGTAIHGRKPTFTTSMPVQPIFQGFGPHLIQHT